MADPDNALAGDGFSRLPIDGGFLFRIERARKLNAMTRPVLEGLSACLDELESTGKSLLVITGEGERAFSAGTDLFEMVEMGLDASLDKCGYARDLLTRIWRSPVLSVAAVNGLALGGGLELAMACNLRVAAPHATFGLPEIKLGLLPAYGGTQFLPLLVGRVHAEELMLTGRTIDADEARAMGLIHRVADDTDVVGAAVAFVNEINAQGVEAADAIRSAIVAAVPQLSDAGLALEDRLVRQVFAGPIAQATVKAFVSKSGAGKGRAS